MNAEHGTGLADMNLPSTVGIIIEDIGVTGAAEATAEVTLLTTP